ncbi:MAG TPA: energy transducer TonB [Chthoniobacterales bacterium]|jgi:TonB family protein|nr:energy transducer TonB [Chthoniobacterales bacterium]
MAAPLLYRPPPRWQFWVAFGSAVMIELGAVLIAAIPKHEQAVDLSQIPTATVEATLQPEDQPTPPPEDIPIQEPPPIPEVAPEFHEEKPPPPKTNKPTGPVKAPQGVTGTMSISGAKAAAIFAPKPDYPYEARSRHVTGSGVCVLTVDVASGNVTDASMAQSIGSPILDNSTTSTFRRWRFRPGAAAPKVKVPITYTMTGASY